MTAARASRRAEIRQQVRAAIAELSRECGPGETVAVIRTHKPCTEEQRPGWIQELPPDERWRLRQAQAWEWALYRRSAEFGWFLPGCLEDAHRRALRLTREGRRTWKRLVCAVAGALASLISSPADTGPPGLAAELLLAHPHTGPPRRGRSWELVALSQSGP